MAKRLKTRLSAGAALVTGLGMMGLATAVPAHAAATMQYSCTTPLGPQVLDVKLDTDAPETATTGEALTITPSGTVTLNESISNAMAGALGWEDVSADIPGVVATISNGTDSADFTTDLSIPRTTIRTNGAWVTDSTPDLPITGTAQSTTIEQAGSYTLSAPDTFNTTFHGYDAAGETGTLSPIASVCTYVPDSGSKVIDTVTVTDAPVVVEPEVDDWFNEPGSLPLVDNVFTVAGDATHAGTLTIQVLGGAKDADGKAIPGDVLKSYTMSAVEGANSADFSLVEGADYVRILSQDCVDEAGNDSSVAGGCNATYSAPWADDGDNDGEGGDPVVGPPTDDGTDTGTDTGTDNGGTAGPERPSVVQTDGLTPAQAPAGDDSAAFLLGGALLAAAGAGSIVLVRRRQGDQR